jgi:hypothetical protein
MPRRRPVARLPPTRLRGPLGFQSAEWALDVNLTAVLSTRAALSEIQRQCNRQMLKMRRIVYGLNRVK